MKITSDWIEKEFRIAKGIAVAITIVFLTLTLYSEDDKNIKTSESQNSEENSIKESEKKGEEKKVSTAEKVFFCAKGYKGPAFLGWCKDGNYYGPVHMGSIGVAVADRFYGLTQVSGFLSLSDNFYGLVQIGGFGAGSKKIFYGFGQIGGAVATSEIFNGVFQFGGLFSVAYKKFNGLVQIGGLITGADKFHGFISLSSIMSGISNFEGGFQISLFSLSGFNFLGPFLSTEKQEKFLKDKKIHGFYGGFQIGVLVSGASTFKGVSQIGAYNVSLQHYGGQIGIVNRSKVVRGVQIGVVNYTEKLYGLQLGLVNIAQNGFLPYTTILNIGW